MATSSKPESHEYQFVDKVPSNYLCKQCKHIAREPASTSCCGESLCSACANIIRENPKSCLFCKKKGFKLEENLNYREQIEALTVYCSQKNKGCEWTGQLKQLNVHLTNDCILDRIKCDQCQESVQRAKRDTHLTRDCPEREHMCQYCNFKATYKIVAEQHLHVCTYYILSCPNRCGATFERGELEDHMKMCAQESVQCEFHYAGCEAEFTRDKQKEHMEQNTQTHLALVAAAIKEQQQRLLELSSKEKYVCFQEEDAIKDDRRSQGWAHVQEVSLDCRYEEFENRMNKRSEEVEQLLKEREQQIRELQEEVRRDERHPGREYQPWSCSMVLPIILASILLAMMLGIHTQNLQAIDQSTVKDTPDSTTNQNRQIIDPSTVEDPPLSTGGYTPDSTFQKKLDELQQDITELKNSIRNLTQPPEPAKDDTSHSERFASLEEEIRKLRQLLEESLQELALNVSHQYTVTQHDYTTVIENIEVKVQETHTKLSDTISLFQTREETRDKKIAELTVRVDGASDLRGRVESLEAKMSELSVKMATLEQRLGELKQQFDDLPPHPPHPHSPRHHHPPHPPHHHHPHHCHHH